MKNYAQVYYDLIDHFFEEEYINEATYQCLADILDGFLPDEDIQNSDQFIEKLKETYKMDDLNIDHLEKYLKREFVSWQEEHENSEEILKERFNIGIDEQYLNVEEFLNDVDLQIMLKILNLDMN